MERGQRWRHDAPNGEPATFTTQIATWCLTCHSRYLSQGWDTQEDDAIYTYRHTSTNTTRNCVTCHVAHGSNAQMTGDYSANMDYPGGAAAPVGDSRLLKIDNRGTCQACHDPTGTIVVGHSSALRRRRSSPSDHSVVAGDERHGHHLPTRHIQPGSR